MLRCKRYAVLFVGFVLGLVNHLYKLAEAILNRIVISVNIGEW